MKNITIRVSTEGARKAAPGFAGAMGSTIAGDTDAVQIEIAGNATIADLTTVTAAAGDTFARTFLDEEPEGMSDTLTVEFLDEALLKPEESETPESHDTEALTHNEETLFKVHRALVRAGLDERQATGCISDMQNNGILFRESA